MCRDNVRVVRALRSSEMVQRISRRVALFKVPGSFVRTCSAAGCKRASFFEESDEERFNGWKACSYDADVHFDDLPDVF